MSADTLLHEILKLPPADRLRLVEEIWNSLAPDQSVPVPEWHREELDRRLEDSSERAGLSWADVQARLRSRKP
jgi:putative addiction module component (TIGR02574 family)